MAPFLAGFAILILLLFLLRGFAFADVKRLARGFRVSGAILLGLIALALLAAGRAGYALLAAGAAWALLMGRPIQLRPPPPGGGMGGRSAPPPPRSGAMSRAEALKVLGLEEGATESEIRAAHRRLILQTHPDKGGSSYLAAKINEAKDVLLGD
jgi:hypothetical protein